MEYGTKEFGNHKEFFNVHVARTHFSKYEVGVSLPYPQELICWGKGLNKFYCNLIISFSFPFFFFFFKENFCICTLMIPQFCSMVEDKDRTRGEITVAERLMNPITLDTQFYLRLSYPNLFMSYDKLKCLKCFGICVMGSLEHTF